MGQQDLKVHELVSKIERGEIRLPALQRQYVWKSTQVRNLLDSLYRGYPSGTILTWETDKSVATRNFSVDVQQNTNSFQLLLDGQQRLTSLYAVINGKPVVVRDKKRPINILFNLEHPDEPQDAETGEKSDVEDGALEEEISEANEEERLNQLQKMAFVVGTKKSAKLKNWVSVTEIFKESSDAPFLKKAGIESFEDLRYNKYVNRLKKLRDIKNYPYRVNFLDRGKTYEEVTEIFVRVNSLGTRLKSSDLALAQITAKWDNALEVFEKFAKECKEKGFDLDLSIHLKNLLVFTTGQSRFDIVNSLPDEKLKTGWDMAKEGMQYALSFLKENVGIDSPILLSSPWLIIPIAYCGHQRHYDLSPADGQKLRRWVLIANAKGRYGRGSTETFLDQDLAAIKNGKGLESLFQMLKTQVGRLEVIPEDLENRDRRSAYFKTMFLAFRKDGAKDWRDQLLISIKHSGKHSLNFHHIFPKAKLTGKRSTKEINDICNLAFIGGHTNRWISDSEPAVYLPNLVKEIGIDELSRQCIPSTQELWELKAYDRFIEERRKAIAQKLNDFLDNNQHGSN